MRFIFSLLLLTLVLEASIAAVTEGYYHRVKRSNSKANETKTTATTTTTTTTERNKRLNETANSKQEMHDEIATEIRSALEKFNSKMPTAVHVRHVKLNRSEPVQSWRDLRRNWENQHCTDIQPRHGKGLLHQRANKDCNHDDQQHKDEKFIEFLTGKSASGTSSSDSTKHLERYARAYLAKENPKKSKRNAMKNSMHHKLHKENKEHKHKRSENIDSSIDNFLRLTNMLMEMSGGGGIGGGGAGGIRPDAGFHAVHHTEVDSLAPFAGERLTEVIYKPIAIDSTNGNGNDDVALIGANEYLSNEFTGIPQPQHAILPMEMGAGYHDFTLPLISNFSPLKILANAAVESGISLSSASDKNENDSDEYEMTCPVHFKRSIDAVNGGSKDGSNTVGFVGAGSGGNSGVLELCTCHLYRKKKQVL